MWQSKPEGEDQVGAPGGLGGSLGGKHSQGHTMGEQQAGWSALPNARLRRMYCQGSAHRGQLTTAFVDTVHIRECAEREAIASF